MTISDKTEHAWSCTDIANMLNSIASDAESYFKVGRARFKRTLPNGAVVTVTIRMPAVKR